MFTLVGASKSLSSASKNEYDTMSFLLALISHSAAFGQMALVSAFLPLLSFPKTMQVASWFCARLELSLRKLDQMLDSDENISKD
jgi:hypothetical protein